MNELLEKVNGLEKNLNKAFDEIEKLRESDRKQDLAVLTIQKDIEVVKMGMVDLKADVVGVIQEQNTKIWDLVNRGVKVLLVLVLIIVAFAGIKLFPDIFKLMM